MKVKYAKGALIGGAVGALVWVSTIFTELPELLRYMAQLWVVKPIVTLFDLGGLGAVLTMILVCVISFAIYGVLIHMLVAKVKGKR